MGKFMQTVAAMACIKSMLMIFNLAFWVSFPNVFSKLTKYSTYSL